MCTYYTRYPTHVKYIAHTPPSLSLSLSLFFKLCVAISVAQDDNTIFVRLTNTVTHGTGSQYEGRVEVYYNDQWGTICSEGWDWEDAHVACVMAGFGTAVRPVTDGYYGSAGLYKIYSLQIVECIYFVWLYFVSLPNV